MVNPLFVPGRYRLMSWRRKSARWRRSGELAFLHRSKAVGEVHHLPLENTDLVERAETVKAEVRIGRLIRLKNGRQEGRCCMPMGF